MCVCISSVLQVIPGPVHIRHGAVRRLITHTDTADSRRHHGTPTTQLIRPHEGGEEFGCIECVVIDCDDDLREGDEEVR